MSKFTNGHHKAAKLSADDVLKIRELYTMGVSQGALSRKFSISIGQIGRICRGESWQGIAGDQPSIQTPADPGISAAEIEASQARLFALLSADDPLCKICGTSHPCQCH